MWDKLQKILLYKGKRQYRIIDILLSILLSIIVMIFAAFFTHDRYNSHSSDLNIYEKPRYQKDLNSYFKQHSSGANQPFKNLEPKE